MVVAGVILLIIAVLIFLAGIFGGTGTDVKIDLGAFDVSMSAAALFLLGVISTLLILIGLGTIRVGARRARAHRRDRKQVDQLSRKLDEARAEREQDEDPDAFTENR